ncbi:hypothetical protein Q6A57_07730, partial [Helicobacter pylori]
MLQALWFVLVTKLSVTVHGFLLGLLSLKMRVVALRVAVLRVAVLRVAVLNLLSTVIHLFRAILISTLSTALIRLVLSKTPLILILLLRSLSLLILSCF